MARDLEKYRNLNNWLSVSWIMVRVRFSNWENDDPIIPIWVWTSDLLFPSVWEESNMWFQLGKNQNRSSPSAQVAIYLCT